METRKTIRFNNQSIKAVKRITSTLLPNYNLGVQLIIARYDAMLNEIELPFTLAEVKQIEYWFSATGIKLNDINTDCKIFPFHVYDAYMSRDSEVNEETYMKCSTLTKLQIIKLLNSIGK